MGGKQHSFGRLKTSTLFISTAAKPNVISKPTLEQLAARTTLAITVLLEKISDAPTTVIEQPSGGSVDIYENSEWRIVAET